MDWFTSIMFWGLSENQDGHPGLWLADTFSSAMAEQNLTKLDRKQELNILYQVCVFPAVLKTNMAILASDWLRHFLYLCNR